MSLEAHFDATEGLLGADDTEYDSLPLGRNRPAVIAFVGMAFEARIAAGPGIHVISRDARHELEAAVAGASRHGYRGIISFGVAGGLAEGLRSGDWVVASAIAEAQGSRPTDAAWSRQLLNAVVGARHAPVIGVDTPVADPTTKRELRRLSGAAAVDMESHVVARLAAAHGLAFAALRVIVDPADRAIPDAALKGMGVGPHPDGVAVMRDLIRRPSQLPHLLRISLDAYIARRAMLRLRHRLGPHFAFAGLSVAGSAEVAPRDLAQRVLAPADLTPADLLLSDLADAGVAPYRSPA
jgi:hopanoid-associated phosphorylase